jgi:hypothetical protein
MLQYGWLLVVGLLLSTPSLAEDPCKGAGSSTLPPINNPRPAQYSFWGHDRAVGFFNEGDSPDFCRAVYLSPDASLPRSALREGRLMCTLGVDTDFGGAYRGRTVCSSRIWLASPDRPGAWADFDGDSRLDYCHVVKVKNLSRARCYLAASGDFSRVIEAKNIGGDWNDAWVDFNEDMMADYCRVVDTGIGYQLWCTLSTGDGFGSTIKSEMLGSDSGLGRWADINDDAKIDYCLVTGKNLDFVACHLSTGSSFTNVRYEYIPAPR